MSLKEIIPELLGSGFLGIIIGGVVMALVDYNLSKKKDIYNKLSSVIEERYRSLLVFMACAIDINAKKYFNEDGEYKTKEFYLEKIKEYYYHNILNASVEVLKTIKKFIIKPDRKNYINVAIAMRHDLWQKDINFDPNDIMIN